MKPRSQPKLWKEMVGMSLVILAVLAAILGVVRLRYALYRLPFTAEEVESATLWQCGASWYARKDITDRADIVALLDSVGRMRVDEQYQGLVVSSSDGYDERSYMACFALADGSTHSFVAVPNTPEGNCIYIEGKNRLRVSNFFPQRLWDGLNYPTVEDPKGYYRIQNPPA